MTWLTWRQLRGQSTVVLAAFAVLAVALLATAHGLRSSYTTDVTGFIDQLQFQPLNRFLYLAGLVAVHSIGPVIGAFWGAPLVARELEAGTHRLVWNQSATRHRWLAMKLLTIGVIAVVAVAPLSWAVTWWSAPIDKAIAAGHGSGAFSLPRITPVVFGARGIVPIGYVVLGLAVGVAVGLLLRRSVPAIALTLVIVGATEILMPQLVRAHLVTPIKSDVVISTDNMEGLTIAGEPGEGGAARIDVRGGSPADWSLSNRTVDATGQSQATLPASFGACVGNQLPGPPQLADGGTTKVRTRGREALQSCFDTLANDGYRQHVTYQPARHFWTLQIRETALLLTLAGLLIGFCFWRVGRDAP